MTTTCASCRYHAERGCYVAPVSVHRKPEDPACVQYASGPQDAPGATQQATDDGHRPPTGFGALPLCPDCGLPLTIDPDGGLGYPTLVHRTLVEYEACRRAARDHTAQEPT